MYNNTFSHTKPQGGFEQDNIRSGDLRDHDGYKVNDAGFMATKHYEGDTKPVPPDTIPLDSPRAAISHGQTKSGGTVKHVPRKDMMIGVRG